MLMTMTKKAPRKVMKTMLDSLVGQNKMDNGTHARGGTGRMISKTGNTIDLLQK